MSDSLLTPYELFQRKDSPNYWMRFSVRGKGQVRIGLKTADAGQAEERAKIEHLRQVELGIKKEYRQQSDGHAVRDFLIPFFGKDRIEAITEAKIQQFIRWRQSYWIDGPGKGIEKREYERNGRRYFQKVKRTVPAANTIRSNCAVLSNVFRFAAANGEVRSADIPVIRMPKAKPNPRPSFSLKEVNQLMLAALERMSEPSLSQRTLYERLVLYCYIGIAAYSRTVYYCRHRG